MWTEQKARRKVYIACADGPLRSLITQAKLAEGPRGEGGIAPFAPRCSTFVVFVNDPFLDNHLGCVMFRPHLGGLRRDFMSVLFEAVAYGNGGIKLYSHSNSDDFFHDN